MAALPDPMGKRNSRDSGTLRTCRMHLRHAAPMCFAENAEEVSLPPCPGADIYVCTQCLSLPKSGSKMTMVTRNCRAHGLAWHRKMSWTEDGWLQDVMS